MDRDHDLLDGLKAGDRSTFDRFFRRYQDRIYGFAAKMVGRDAADDVTQEVFIEAYRSIGRFRGRSTLKTWLFRITVHVAHKHRRSRHEELPLDESAAGDGDPVEAAEANRQAARLDWALGQLSDEMREVMLLNKVLGFSYAECAEIAGCPIGTIKSRIANAMARLRELLADDENKV